MDSWHNQLLQKYSRYHHWHQHPRHPFWHWLVFSFVVIFVFNHLYARIGDYLNEEVLSLSIQTPQAQAAVIAFPTAEGFGANTVGGRGGAVIHVTNLNDTGAGSFRAALEASGPRTVVFDISGNIDCRNRIEINSPNITIAGQTSPGQGVTAMCFLFIRANEVIIRDLRVRPGPVGAGTRHPAENPESSGGIFVSRPGTILNNVILDHVSESWHTDDGLAVGDATNVTIQWSIGGQSIQNGGKSEWHGKGALFSAYSGLNALSVSFHHNLLIHHQDRVPFFQGGKVDFVNNLIYNHDNAAEYFMNYGAGQTNAVGNYWLRGPNSVDLLSTGSGIRLYTVADGSTQAGNSPLYISGNIDSLARPNNSYPENAILTINSGSTVPIVSTRYSFPFVPTTDAFQAKTDVMAKAGTRVPTFDSLDTTFISNINNLTGQYVGNSPSEVGGYPVLSVVSRPAGYDTDQDGMPDTWESSHGLNSTNASDRNFIASNGYTNLENYINELAGDPVSGSTPTPTPTPIPTSDTTPPVISNGSPSGTLPAGTVSSVFSVTTNESATCKYSGWAGSSYALMPGIFSNTGGTTHSTTSGGQSNGATYNWYIRCQDLAGNANSSDYVISYTIATTTTPTPTPTLTATPTPTPSPTGGVIYYVSTTGNDANSCTQARSTTTPKRTINNAMSCLVAGDTLYVRAGTYNERIAVTKSGNATQGYITLGAYPGEKPVIDGTGLGNGDMVSGHGIKYFKVQGFHIKNHTGAGMAFYGASDHLQILSNEISNQTFQSGAGHGILVTSVEWPNLLSANDIIIDGNYLHDISTGTATVYNEALTVAWDVNRFQITNNIVERANHIGIDTIGKTAAFTESYLPNTIPIPANATPWPRFGYIANNTVRNIATRTEDSAIYLDGGKDIVVEKNKVHDNIGYGMVTSAEDPAFTMERIIVRNNEAKGNFRNFAPGAISSDGNHIVRFVHNTVYTADAGDRSLTLFKGNNIILKNNISRNIAGNLHLEHYIGTTYSPTLNYNCYYPSNGSFQYKGNTYSSFSAYQSTTGQDTNSLTADPLFVNPAALDFKLQSTSPCINKGDFLTRTTSTGSGTIIPVQDSYYFSNGYGVTTGDLVQIGSNTAYVTAVDHVAKTLTLDRTLSWSNGTGVSYPYSGSAPDMGAYEYGGIVAPSPTPTPTPTPTLSSCDLNKDGSTNILDFQLLANIILGITPNTGGSDINKDGQVNILDTQVLANVILGKTSCP